LDFVAVSRLNDADRTADDRNASARITEAVRSAATVMRRLSNG